MAAVPDPIRNGAGLAWDIHRSGWGEQFTTNQQFQEFGNDIKTLAQNLSDITRVVDNARTAWISEYGRLFRPRGQIQQRNWDLSSLDDIIGDYGSTLLECQRLLAENYEFKRSRNFANSTDWAVKTQPKIDELQKKLEAHNSKISFLLRPLEFFLLSGIHRELSSSMDPRQRNVLYLQGLYILNIEQAISEQANPPQLSLDVPPDIARKFKAAAEKVHPDVRISGRFPLQAGADAFVSHFQASTRNFTAGNSVDQRTPLTRQYLALLKCIWIIQMIQAREVDFNTPPDSQWPGYISQLLEDLVVECNKFTGRSTQVLVRPDLSAVRQDEEFEIWPIRQITEYISPRSEGHLGEVLRIPMPTQSQVIQRQISVYRLESNSKYRLIESVEDYKSNSARREEFRLDIDLKTVNLTPIYAIPTSRPKPLELYLTSSTTQLNPTFQDIKHVLKLQHLLTGYKVFERYDQPMVTVTFTPSGHAAPVVEHGRLQLWVPHPFSSSSISNTTSPTSTAPQSPTSSGQASFNTAMGSLNLTDGSRSDGGDDLTIRQDPLPPLSSSRLSIRSLSTRIKNRTASIVTNSSSTSRSTVTSTTTVSTGNGGKANLHMKPVKPMLVIFLKSRDESAKLAMVAVQIDDDTKVERERCQCRSSSSQCRISCLERSGGDGHLLVQRWDAKQGMGSWNLAQLGIEQRKELPAHAWDNLKRISMKFEKFEDRYQFSGSPCSCKPVMQRDLARCILEGHHGTFGVVKQIGSQRLKNYHQDRDDTSKRSMVLGSLPENQVMLGRDSPGGGESAYSAKR